ncbi:MAG: hypothetical protein KDD06_10930 [Phaeodactylibacter sp.]|nr:hypothetical protein [Phaeodactylibacter sp.]MCB9267591.1 hypothetical protein [Lewinellaceae bacterium]MCB9287920.1 hypothetical protein [Lewinellaceae bacterium]
MKEIFRITISLAGIFLIVMGIMNWAQGLQAVAKFMLATGIWFELLLFSTLGKEQSGQ